jgi:hypothetical protein
MATHWKAPSRYRDSSTRYLLSDRDSALLVNRRFTLACIIT